METLMHRPVVEAARTFFFNLAQELNIEQSNVLVEWQVGQIESVLGWEDDHEWYIYLIEHLNKEGALTDPTQVKIRDFFRQELKLERINRLESERDGFPEVFVYKTKLNRIFVVTSSLKHADGSISTAWSLARIDPGKEDQYLWLPKGYFDSSTES